MLLALLSVYRFQCLYGLETAPFVNDANGLSVDDGEELAVVAVEQEMLHGCEMGAVVDRAQAKVVRRNVVERNVETNAAQCWRKIGKLDDFLHVLIYRYVWFVSARCLFVFFFFFVPAGAVSPRARN